MAETSSRRRLGSNSMGTNIPTEIIEREILPRLPAKSLVRFKQVSKFFKTLISTPEFASHHLRHPQPLILLVRSKKLFSFDLDSLGSNPIEVPICKDLEGKNPSSRAKIRIVGSCNGLVCIQASSPCNGVKYSGFFFVLNPSTGTFHTIPVRGQHDNDLVLSFGFGYDSENDDYKIVVVKWSWDGPTGVKKDAMVYSLKDNSWRLVEETVCSHRDIIDSNQPTICALIDSHLVHWLEHSSYPDATNVIGCFNLRTERRGDNLLLPSFQGNDLPKSGESYLGVLDGRLCLATVHKCSRFDVWIMKEYGVRESWMKLLSHVDPEISYAPKLRITPLCYRGWLRNTEVLISQRGKLISYNVEEKTANEVEIPGFDDFDVDAYICTGSLVDVRAKKVTGK